MPITTDFLLLYDELKVTPDCSVDHFKRAYRRRVAELHPDRTHGAAKTAATTRLQTLTRLHDEAMRFHERHGRLPGANQVVPSTFVASPARGASAAPVIETRSTLRRLIIAGLIVSGVVLAWLLLPDDGAGDAAAPDSVSSVRVERLDEQGRFLTVGMDESGVRRVQGEPVLQATDRWEYGPSYVRFEHHKVVSWYSSPLYPLKTGVPGRNPSKTSD